jgi:hypothetical protein
VGKCECKIAPLLNKPRCLEDVWVSGGVAPLILNLGDGREWLTSRDGRFISGEKTASTHGMGVWVGPRAGLDAVAKSKKKACLAPIRNRTPAVQPVA